MGRFWTSWAESSTLLLLAHSLNQSVRSNFFGHRFSYNGISLDWVKLGIPDYPKIVKKPMDLGTMRSKLDSNAYPTAEKFRDDIKLIISNCFLYNPPDTPVHQAGLELKKLFEEKWKGLPPLRAESEDEEEEDETDSEDERTRASTSYRISPLHSSNCSLVTIAAMESQIETMRNSISALKNQKEKKSKKSKKKDASASTPATTSKAAKKETKAPPKKKVAPKKAQIPDDDVLSFEQKKDLSEAIQTLDGQKLERVIQIIHEGVPEIRDVRFVQFYKFLDSEPSDRAKRRLNWRSILSLRQFLPSCTILSSVLYVSLL